MSRRGFGVMVVLTSLVATLLLTACSRSDPPPAAPSFVVPGTPSEVCELILPEIRDRIAQDTKVVRIDSATSVSMRFTAYLEDRSVRLVEIALAPASAPATTTTATVRSKRFSFLPVRSRDSADATLENSLADLIKRRTEPAR